MTPDGVLIGDRYRLVNRIGAGAMGIVWEGWDERLRRAVAVKQLHPQRGLSDEEAAIVRDRAMREARITARLHHPHAVPVFDVVEHDGQPCLIMQYLPSTSLQAVISREGTLPVAEVARIGAEIASALAAAHRAGIVHRDVKPGNVLIGDDGSAKISDFGISHALGDGTLTSTGMLTGTPAFLAPEVARGAPSTFGSDVFSLGATLYNAVEGTPPFGTDDNAMALLHRVALGQVLPPSRAGVLTPLLTRLLASVPEDRPTMDAAASELAAVAVAAPVTGSGAGPSVTSILELPTRETSAPEPPAPEPSTPAPPPQPPQDEDREGGDAEDREWVERPERVGRRRVVAVLAALAGLVLAVLLAVQLFGRGGGAAPAAGPASTPAVSSTPPPSPSSPPSSSPPSTTSTTSTTAAVPTAAQLGQAISDYYGLLPGNTDAGWTRLTASFQVGKAKSRQVYQGFWDSIASVSVIDATGQPPGTAEATLTYRYKDGRVIRERASYGLVMQDGILKINTSTVLSSQKL